MRLPFTPWVILGAMALQPPSARAFDPASEWRDAVAMIRDPVIQRSLSEVTALSYLDGSGRGALLTTNTREFYLVLETVNPIRQTTCEVAGRLDQSMTYREDGCEISVRQDTGGGISVQSRSCSDLCGMGASFSGHYARSPRIFLQPTGLGEDGRMTYRPK